MLLVLSAILLAGYVVNVSMGSSGGAPVLGNVGEMLLLFSVSILFTASILNREAARNTENQQ